MAITDELIREVANVIAHGVNAEGGAPGWSQATARDLLENPALIKRMAEGVGFEVKEKPARYVVVPANYGYEYCRVNDDKLSETVVWMSTKAFPDATERCHAMADELNSKERGQ